MALNRFHDNSIPSYHMQPRRVMNAAAVPGGANDALFYTAFSSMKTVFADPNPNNTTAQDNAKAHLNNVLMYGLATVALLYVIYRS